MRAGVAGVSEKKTAISVPTMTAFQRTGGTAAGMAKPPTRQRRTA